MEKVDLQGASHVIDAIPMCRVGPRPDRVLKDPDAVGHDLEMLPADGKELPGVRH
jgi:hypothetical protein